ncbi:MAG: ABC transporter ATP-binding protein [Burkholderiales bacterium]
MAYIEARNIEVSFPIFGSQARSFRKSLWVAATGGAIARNASDRVTVHALKGISFSINQGDRVGLVGHNGSGKSTLLRVLAGAYEPNSGEIHVEGRVASMLDLYLGMDLEATGYENIFLRAILLGCSRKEVAEITDEICEFAGLGDFIHMPLRTYSSGMAMRLGFAISTSIKSEIVLMDEWLSVGDQPFVEKANRRLHEMVDQAQILVVASHSEELIRKNCNKIFHLSHGQLMEIETVQ